MSGHVPPDTACSGEHHITLSTLIHLGAIMRPEMSIETTPGQELLVALEADDFRTVRFFSFRFFIFLTGRVHTVLVLEHNELDVQPVRKHFTHHLERMQRLLFPPIRQPANMAFSIEVLRELFER